MGQLLQGTGTGSHAKCQELNDFESRAALAFQSTHQVGLRCGQSGRAAKLAVFFCYMSENTTATYASITATRSPKRLWRASREDRDLNFWLGVVSTNDASIPHLYGMVPHSHQDVRSGRLKPRLSKV